MTVKELKEALANVPASAEVYMDDGCSINAIQRTMQNTQKSIMFL